MTEAIAVCICTGIFTIISTILTVYAGNVKIQHDLKSHNAVQDERIKQLTQQVEKHNRVVERTIISTILTVYAGNVKIQHDLKSHNAVQDERIKQLTQQVEKHNRVVERVFKLEEDVKHLQEQ